MLEFNSLATLVFLMFPNNCFTFGNNTVKQLLHTQIAVQNRHIDACKSWFEI